MLILWPARALILIRGPPEIRPAREGMQGQYAALPAEFG